MPQHWNRLLVILAIGLCLWASDFGSAMSSIALADNKDALDQVALCLPIADGPNESGFLHLAVSRPHQLRTAAPRPRAATAVQFQSPFPEAL